MLVIGHRGAPRVARENTVEAFRAAADAGADMVELDVRRTADGTLAVHHDAALADGRALVDLRAGDLPAYVPTLAAALDASAGMSVNIEIKNSQLDADFDPTFALAGAVASLVIERGDVERVVVSSFNLGTIDAVHAHDARIRTGFLTFPGVDVVPLVAIAVERGHTAIHPYDTDTTADVVNAAHESGLQVNVWTVDDPDRMRELAALGVDGLVTNVPDVAVKALRAG